MIEATGPWELGAISRRKTEALSCLEAVSRSRLSLTQRKNRGGNGIRMYVRCAHCRSSAALCQPQSFTVLWALWLVSMSQTGSHAFPGGQWPSLS